ncbi:hypothetical protein BV898_19198 [Hypsibius exemplaris]|uniref:Apple domain-containing protein n=1 Tax=Hypsibius exemplaris TaxID=2072580 RepID=A0A9X6NRR3_HYPEX|nr:hypothetical protein BV898_19198 [Hypsibius exemplaris]
MEYFAPLRGALNPTSINLYEAIANVDGELDVNLKSARTTPEPTVVEAITTSTASTASNTGIKWNGNWAFACDFSSINDLSRTIVVRGEECSTLCASTLGCTHFTWNPAIYGGSYCFMKSGPVSKADAFQIDGYPNVRCGISYDENYDYSRLDMDLGPILISCDYPSADDLRSMSLDDRRNTIIVAIAKRTPRSVGELQAMKNSQLAKLAAGFDCVP